MRAEPWMNDRPARVKSPLEVAREDLQNWSARQRSLIKQLSECDCELSKAVERLDALEARSR